VTTTSAVAPDVRAALRGLERRIKGYGERAVVAFSGGVDSSVVLALAARALSPPAVTAVTALSPSLPVGELDAAAGVAADLGVEHRTVTTRELEREAYARNDEMRCFHCKAELYATLGEIVAIADRATTVLAGANADDLSDFRPGLWAGARAGIRNPLLEEGVRKGSVRAVARALGLRVADKPALACLSSRVELGLRITPELLGRIDAAERTLRALGFDVVRVRHRGDLATIEVSAEEVPRLASHPDLDRALTDIRDLGWAQVTVDPLGYRQGSVGPLS
jgi:pyridinium-3,5-biscarboxylic acid mononucleotide sulfurtransferase